MDESVYVEFVVLLSTQHETNLAAVIAHCCISPNRYGSLLASGVFLKSLHAFVVRREACVRSVVRQGALWSHLSERCGPTGQS